MDTVPNTTTGTIGTVTVPTEQKMHRVPSTYAAADSLSTLRATIDAANRSLFSENIIDMEELGYSLVGRKPLRSEVKRRAPLWAQLMLYTVVTAIGLASLASAVFAGFASYEYFELGRPTDYLETFGISVDTESQITYIAWIALSAIAILLVALVAYKGWNRLNEGEFQKPAEALISEDKQSAHLQFKDKSGKIWLEEYNLVRGDDSKVVFKAKDSRGMLTTGGQVYTRYLVFDRKTEHGVIWEKSLVKSAASRSTGTDGWAFKEAGDSCTIRKAGDQYDGTVLKVKKPGTSRSSVRKSSDGTFRTLELTKSGENYTLASFLVRDRETFTCQIVDVLEKLRDTHPLQQPVGEDEMLLFGDDDGEGVGIRRLGDTLVMCLPGTVHNLTLQPSKKEAGSWETQGGVVPQITIRASTGDGIVIESDGEKHDLTYSSLEDIALGETNDLERYEMGEEECRIEGSTSMKAIRFGSNEIKFVATSGATGSLHKTTSVPGQRCFIATNNQETHGVFIWNENAGELTHHDQNSLGRLKEIPDPFSTVSKGQSLRVISDFPLAPDLNGQKVYLTPKENGSLWISFSPEGLMPNVELKQVGSYTHYTVWESEGEEGYFLYFDKIKQNFSMTQSGRKPMLKGEEQSDQGEVFAGAFAILTTSPPPLPAAKAISNPFDEMKIGGRLFVTDLRYLIVKTGEDTCTLLWNGRSRPEFVKVRCGVWECRENNAGGEVRLLYIDAQGRVSVDLYSANEGHLNYTEKKVRQDETEFLPYKTIRAGEVTFEQDCVGGLSVSPAYGGRIAYLGKPMSDEKGGLVWCKGLAEGDQVKIHKVTLSKEGLYTYETFSTKADLEELDLGRRRTNYRHEIMNNSPVIFGNYKFTTSNSVMTVTFPNGGVQTLRWNKDSKRFSSRTHFAYFTKDDQLELVEAVDRTRIPLRNHGTPTKLRTHRETLIQDGELAFDNYVFTYNKRLGQVTARSQAGNWEAIFSYEGSPSSIASKDMGSALCFDEEGGISIRSKTEHNVLVSQKSGAFKAKDNTGREHDIIEHSEGLLEIELPSRGFCLFSCVGNKGGVKTYFSVTTDEVLMLKIDEINRDFTIDEYVEDGVQKEAFSVSTPEQETHWARAFHLGEVIGFPQEKKSGEKASIQKDGDKVSVVIKPRKGGAIKLSLLENPRGSGTWVCNASEAPEMRRNAYDFASVVLTIDEEGGTLKFTHSCYEVKCDKNLFKGEITVGDRASQTEENINRTTDSDNTFRNLNDPADQTLLTSFTNTSYDATAEPTTTRRSSSSTSSSSEGPEESDYRRDDSRPSSIQWSTFGSSLTATKPCERARRVSFHSESTVTKTDQTTTISFEDTTNQTQLTSFTNPSYNAFATEPITTRRRTSSSSSSEREEPKTDRGAPSPKHSGCEEILPLPLNTSFQLERSTPKSNLHTEGGKNANLDPESSTVDLETRSELETRLNDNDTEPPTRKLSIASLAPSETEQDPKTPEVQ